VVTVINIRTKNATFFIYLFYVFQIIKTKIVELLKYRFCFIKKRINLINQKMPFVKNKRWAKKMDVIKND